MPYLFYKRQDLIYILSKNDHSPGMNSWGSGLLPDKVLQLAIKKYNDVL